MIEDAVARIQAIEQQLTQKTRRQLQARLTIRGCLKELRHISGHHSLASAQEAEIRPAH
ncbi:hypothetical protein [Bradyrhizobium sp.]|uniref:hypothetical protein n=1 Tax=Bradyrhizobium sp. TaxID=376 RepID=UPI00403805AD